jgi:hypothetical protein
VVPDHMDRVSGANDLRDVIEVLNPEATLKEGSDDGAVLPAEEPEGSGTAVCPRNVSGLSVNSHRGDFIERRVPLRPERKTRDEFHAIFSD